MDDIRRFSHSHANIYTHNVVRHSLPYRHRPSPETPARCPNLQSTPARCHNLQSTPLQPQPPPHARPDDPFILASPLPPHARRIHIRRALIIRLRQHAHHADEDLLHALDRAPPLRRLLVVVRVVARRVQDRDADEARRVDFTTGSCQRQRACILRIRARGV